MPSSFVIVMSTNIRDIDPTFKNRVYLKHNLKENNREQELTAKKVAKKIAKERLRPRARKEALAQEIMATL